MGEVIKIDKPYPKQEEFFKATVRYICYGGARGGGKSWAMRTKDVLLALKYPGIQILLLRRTLAELQENHINVLQKMFANKPTVGYYRDAKKELIFTNGSRIKLGYCENEKDVLQYQGQAYDVICLEEATLFTEFQFQALTESLRPSGQCKVAFRPRMYFTCNPGGVGHVWVKRLFIDRDYTTNENPDDYVFIAAKVFDNEFLMKTDPDYVQTLMNLPEDRRKAMLDGNWDVYDGQYFKEFNRDIHVIEPFEIPPHWKIYFTMDYGLDMLAGYWIAMDTEGNAFVFREVAQSDLIVSEAAAMIKQNTHEKIYSYLAPPDMWSRRQETGKSVADLFAMSGITLSKTSNNRVDGWLSMKEWLKIVNRKQPDGSFVKSSALKIFNNCTYLIKCIPQLQYDQKRISDVASEPHDITHGPDALRGFCVSYTSPTKEIKQPKKVNFDFEKPKRKPGGQGTRSRAI